MPDKITVLLLGDVFGQPGCRALFVGLKSLAKECRADLVVVNGENAADGFGITPEIADRLFASGADVLTSGNHIWQKREILPFLDSQERMLRPGNYPPGVPGHGSCIVEVKGVKVGVLNLQGRLRMGDLDCPFRVGADMVRKLREKAKVIVVDFHAEAPEEKEALAFYLDGQVSSVTGTHTHVQTADERIYPKGTAYISDIGMTGPVDSVIGCDMEISLRRSATQMPLKMEVSDTPAAIQGVKIEIDVASGKALSIERVVKHSLV
ncbi:TIGR00282 family metallophosphoesterase [Sediminispirochaeta bajacaliforniensis]|uniref:TIGR00282 family metallophosphoesterase n=1 Tax=Sediminispirochaeta bajacaliforniensis TaxID=148 RepID=UPI00037C55FE|nr:TIGR00282 family metallophosphoesterase [Sediminispirochaeta bajacaliforniensis]